MDLMEGIGKDRAGIRLLSRMGVPGIVTTKSNLVKYAREEGICAIQRLFIVDSESLKTAIRVAGSVRAYSGGNTAGHRSQVRYRRNEKGLGLAGAGRRAVKDGGGCQEGLGQWYLI